MGGGGVVGRRWLGNDLCQALTGLKNFFVLNLGRCPRLECIALSGHFFEGIAEGGEAGRKDMDEHGRTRTDTNAVWAMKCGDEE